MSYLSICWIFPHVFFIFLTYIKINNAKNARLSFVTKILRATVKDDVSGTKIAHATKNIKKQGNALKYNNPPLTSGYSLKHI